MASGEQEKESQDQGSKEDQSKDDQSKDDQSKDDQSKDDQSKKEESQEAESQEEESTAKESGPDTRPPSIVYGPAAPRPLTLTFGELLDHHAEVRPNKPAIISHVQGYTISWSQLRKRSLQLARAFAQDGIAKGDLVAISMGSRVEYFEVISSLLCLATSTLIVG